MPRHGAVRYQPSSLTALALSPGVGAAMVSIATSAIPYAVSISPGGGLPYRGARGRTGEYHTKFEVHPAQVNITTRYGRQRRAGAILENTSEHATSVEFGWKEWGVNGYLVLAKTARHLTSPHRSGGPL